MIVYIPFHIWDVILPIDELIFFKVVKTTNQKTSLMDHEALESSLGFEFLACFSGDAGHQMIAVGGGKALSKYPGFRVIPK